MGDEKHKSRVIMATIEMTLSRHSSTYFYAHCIAKKRRANPRSGIYLQWCAIICTLCKVLLSFRSISTSFHKIVLSSPSKGCITFGDLKTTMLYIYNEHRHFNIKINASSRRKSSLKNAMIKWQVQKENTKVKTHSWKYFCSLVILLSCCVAEAFFGYDK